VKWRAFAALIPVLCIGGALIAYGREQQQKGQQQQSAQQLVSPDPSLDATCIAEPNSEPACMQGTEPVAITIGRGCHVPESGMRGQTWQYTYSGSDDVRCMGGTPLPPPGPPDPAATDGPVSCYADVCRQGGSEVSFGVSGSGDGPDTGDQCGPGETWQDIGTAKGGAELYACRST
jgi:hypothetical protein